MATSHTLPTFLGVNLVTPKGVVAVTEADGITAPGEMGEFELLPGHVPLLTALKPGVLTLAGKNRTRYAVSSGYLRVDPSGTVEILVDQADLSSTIKADEVRAELKAAEADLAKLGDSTMDGEWKNIQHRIDWARAQLDAVAA
jgi:F-type H+-transporting ATPase subunit epsilon